jgi:hypothetical protein
MHVPCRSHQALRIGGRSRRAGGEAVMPTLTRVVHAAVLLDFDGHQVLTDPWFSQKPGYYHG